MPIEAFQYDETYSARLTESGEIEFFTHTGESGTEVEHKLDGQTIRLTVPSETPGKAGIRCLKLSFTACRIRYPSRFVDSLTDRENGLLPPIPSTRMPFLKSWVRKAVRHERA